MRGSGGDTQDGRRLTKTLTVRPPTVMGVVEAPWRDFVEDTFCWPPLVACPVRFCCPTPFPCRDASPFAVASWGFTLRLCMQKDPSCTR